MSSEDQEPLIGANAGSFRSKSYASSLWVMYYQSFLSTFATTVVIPSMWPFMQSIDGSATMYGLSISAFCFGAFIFSPILGRWADKRPFREPLLASAIISIVGWILYATAQNKWMILVSRFLAGSGMGSAGLSQAYIGKVTTNENRGAALSRQLEASSLGYAFGPGSGALLFYFIKFRIGMFEINPFTIPGYISVILTLFFVFLILVFVEQPISQEEMTSTHIQNDPETEKSKKDNLLTFMIVAWICISGVCFAGVSIMGYEAIVVPQTQEAFNWGIFENSILVLCFGILIFASIKLAQVVLGKVSEKALFLFGQVVMLASFVLFTSVGTQKYELWRFIVATIVFGVFHTFYWFPIFPIYSKSIKPEVQGLWMGFLQQGVMVGRVVGPLWTGFALDYGGVNLVWYGIGGLSLLYFIVCLIFYKKLAPEKLL